MQTGYALLFNYILLPMCDLERSRIRDDPSKAYHFKFDKFSNIYGTQLVICGTYGHNLVKIFLDDFVWWYGVAQHDGVQGVLYGYLYHMWENGAYHGCLIE